MKGVTVHPFRVVVENKKAAPLDRVLEAIKRTPLEQRMRLCSHVPMRVEAVERHSDGFYLIDFTRLRYEGAPGRASGKKPVSDIDFAVGEGAAEETAALYDPANNHLLVQYNHHGARSARIAEYLSSFDDVAENLYGLETRFEPEVERRLAQKQIIKAIRFRVATDAVSVADKSSGNSLTQVLEPARELGAEFIEIRLNAERIRERGLQRGSLNKILGWLHKRMDVHADSVTALEVTGKVDADDKAETINLLGNRMAASFSDLKVGPGLRYPRQARWQALIRARSGWLKQLR